MPSAPRRFALVALLALPCAAQVNQVVGRVGFSNTDPAVLTVLGTPGMTSLRTSSVSLPPAPDTFADATFDATGPVVSDWSLDVASSPAGVTHRVTAVAWVGTGFYRDEYHFLPKDSPPVLDEPAPDAALDVLECAGVIRVRYVDESGSPVAVQGDRVTADSSAGGTSPVAFPSAGATRKDVIVRGDGSTYTVRVEITVGTDPFTDRMTLLRSGTAVVGCDEIVDFPVTLTVPGSAELATIRGDLDVLGEDEVAAAGSVANTRSHVEGTGPWRNLRACAIPGPPSAGAWSLVNLVASDVVTPAVPYQVKAMAGFGRGHAFSSFTTPAESVLVTPGSDVDLGALFVIDPVEIGGAVVLAGPSDPRRPSLLTDAWRASDRDANADGVPDDLARMYDSTVVIGRGRAGVAPGATRSALGAEGYASIDGGFDAASSAFVGRYRLVMGNLGSEPGYYASDELNLKLRDLSTPTDPPSFVDESLALFEAGPQWELPGGGAEIRDRGYCFSRVKLSYAHPAAFFDPDMTGAGTFSGTDFTGRATAYDATLQWAHGTPSLASQAATSGQSYLLLPEGEWTLEPTVRVVNPGGPSTITPLPPLGLHVGCRQSLEVAPEVQVAIDSEAPPCAASATLRVSGRAHADAGVDAIAWLVNGGARQIACVACGVDATFAFDATLDVGDNVVRVEATDASGRVAAAEVYARRASEPSAVRVTRDPGGLAVSWDPEPRDTFAVHAGSLPSLHAGAYDHALVGSCGLVGAFAVIAAPPGDAYLLVTSGCGEGHGSFGRDSFGVERPPDASGCR